MFIYKVTVIPLNQVYIGLDTKDSSKLSRWKTHIRESRKTQKTKFQKALHHYGSDQCTIEVIHDNVNSIVELMCLEMAYIEQYDSYRNGLNSSKGGDGWGHHQLYLLSEEELRLLKENFGKTLTDYNNNVKWANTTKEERLAMIRESMFLTPESIAKRTESLKAWYEADPSRKATKLQAWKKWREDNPEKSKENCRKNGAKSADVTGKPIKVEFPDNSIRYFKNQQAFKRETGKTARYLIKQTLLGLDVNGYKAWFINKQDIDK